ncbi:hypothetical protein K9M79_06940 [Candidatus Woesearchaeota archaeon]|nr:hypothetical protein [Candidatus Woesearchaeota archaeon]
MKHIHTILMLIFLLVMLVGCAGKGTTADNKDGESGDNSNVQPDVPQDQVLDDGTPNNAQESTDRDTNAPISGPVKAASGELDSLSSKLDGILTDRTTAEGGVDFDPDLG